MINQSPDFIQNLSKPCHFYDYNEIAIDNAKN